MPSKENDMVEVELNEDNIENEIVELNEMVETKGMENKAKDPKLGMMFDSIDDAVIYYRKYAKEKGFAMAKRTSKKGDDGVVRYVTIACKLKRTRSTNPVKLKPQTKTDCKAQLRLVLCPNGKWILRSMVLDHNHGLSPSKTRFYKCNRIIEPHVKKKLELNNKAGGHENLSFLEKDCRNHMEKVRCSLLREGDASAMHHYFLKMQADNSKFFYTMDFDDDGRLKNVSWVDARSRAAFKEFSDVITFDTTYMVNKYEMPFAPFVGVNHHGQSTLLGCGLILREDTNSFIWLFKSWLACMYECPPNAIIKDQDKAMKKAIEIVFPNARHRWCLWHIMNKLPDKFKGFKDYEPIKFCIKNVVRDSLTKEEFEESWGRFIKKYQLESNEWLLGLYDERHRWVLAFVKDTFWARMSTTQQTKVHNETIEDFNSFNSHISCIAIYDMEKQFQSAYTLRKFTNFENKIVGSICCSLSSCKEHDNFSEYEVYEDVSHGEGRRSVIFHVYFNEDNNEVNCKCRLFEFKGIVCRHQILVFIHRKIYRILDKYILNRWNKNVKRRHYKVRISYDNWCLKPKAFRYEKMCNAFYEGANLAADFENAYKNVMTQICEMKGELKEGGNACGSNKPISMDIQNDSTSCGNGLVISKEAKEILDPVVICQKGRPSFKRKMSKVQQVVKKKKEKEKKMKMKTTINEGNVVNPVETSILEEICEKVRL
ncbi:hypothetical protein ACB092_04G153500 [Castanea dentata]